MVSSKLTLALASLIICLVLALPGARAQDSPQDYGASHNAARKQVGVGPIQWDEKVAAYARAYANKRVGDCDMIHSGGPYSENFVWGSWDMSGVEAVKMWVDEKPYYNYGSNSCAGGKMCGHYTQIVWRDSTRVRCAKVKCKKGGNFVTCNYDPPGNIIGQKPY